MMESRVNSWYAFATVLLLRSRSLASWRIEGRESPGFSTPAVTAALTCSMSCSNCGRGLSMSMVISTVRHSCCTSCTHGTSGLLGVQLPAGALLQLPARRTGDVIQITSGGIRRIGPWRRLPAGVMFEVLGAVDIERRRFEPAERERHP